MIDRITHDPITAADILRDIAQLERWHRQARDAGLVDLTVYLAREIAKRREMAAETEGER